MTSSRGRSLSSLFRASVKSKVIVPSKAAPPVSLEGDGSFIDDAVIFRRSTRPPVSSDVERNSSLQSRVAKSDSARSVKEFSKEITSLLCGSVPYDTNKAHDLVPKSDKESCPPILDIPWLSFVPKSNAASRQKFISRERKQKWIFKNTQERRFQQLIKACANKIGIEAALHVFGKLGRETGAKEYNALIGLYIEKARNTDNEEVRIQQILGVFQLFKKMRQHGFCLDEDSYGPLLLLLVDMGMIEEFGFFSQIIKDDNKKSISKLGYYEMLLWIKVNNRERVQQLCSYITSDIDNADGLWENYLKALCECNEEVEILKVLEKVDITRISNADCITSLFRSLGRLLLEPLAVDSFSKLKEINYGDDKISELIHNYVVNIPNLEAENVVGKVRNLHNRVGLILPLTLYEKLIRYCCDSFEVHLALDVAHQMKEAGLEMSADALNSILVACDSSCNFNLVYQIYSMIHQYNLKPNGETFKIMIYLCARMKDFEGAYNILNGIHKMNLIASSGMYNAIMAGYFREKNVNGAMRVLKEMEAAGVKPDSQTFSYLISNCHCEEDVIKYYDGMKVGGVIPTKHIYMALTHAYAACGQFDKAKQVVRGTEVPLKALNEIRSSLVSALAIHGKTSDALEIYEEIKRVGGTLEPKAACNFIEHLQSETRLDLLLQLLGEMDDTEYWIDGCCKVIIYCTRQADLSSAVDLMKRVHYKFPGGQSRNVFDEVFSQIADIDVTDSQFGVAMLRAMMKEFSFRPSRKCLDFLLCKCVHWRDLDNCHLIWLEYENAGLPYNVLSFLWMYQGLLACGDCSAANRILNMIPTDDPHVRTVITACKRAFPKTDSSV